MPSKPSAGKAFEFIDRHLDARSSGPMFLGQDAVAAVVEAALGRGADAGEHSLGPWVIMPNHVHLLLCPHASLSPVLKRIKGASAREANRILGRTGIPFWQRESYDHCVRTDQEWFRIRAYIENNPVRAGLVCEPGMFRWSSAREVGTRL